MKKFLIILLFLSFLTGARSQTNKTELLQGLEQKKPADQNALITATLSSSSRLFKDKDDLTSVILVIPSGSTVTVLGSDSTYLHVTFEENEGYINKHQAVIDKSPVVSTEMTASQPEVRDTPLAQPDKMSRFSYLENKYGSGMAARIYAGKIWKGMNAGMVKDSWGPAQKINREVSGNIIKEEWIYKNSWLYFENTTLIDWGPTAR
jgi:hypothetical protein